MSIWVVLKFLKKNYIWTCSETLEHSSNENNENYHDLYLKCDVLLSVQVFEKLKNNSLKNCKFDLVSNALMTKFDLDVTSDLETYLFFEKRIRGSYF